MYSASPRPRFFFLIIPQPPRSTLFPYTTLFRSHRAGRQGEGSLAAVLRLDDEHLGIALFDRALYAHRSEEHTSELQSRVDLVCRLLLEKKKERLRAHMMDTARPRPRHRDVVAAE